ncbi:unnamed protein product [Notodromas monacha]|uniref:Yippee domain-containing protein n=1 Tax=Notodromas monacha TaxID=399045 RepID=A0A7R9BP23_9CRUS|nr:unnamed protein product [Notodromas monacha]CAG0917673.1 unnamed protein product [Notodromas monacha]
MLNVRLLSDGITFWFAGETDPHQLIICVSRLSRSCGEETSRMCSRVWKRFKVSSTEPSSSWARKLVPAWIESVFLVRSSGRRARRNGENMVKTFQVYLPNCHRTYLCVHCRAHLANHDELISKSFQGSQGRAYLFNSVVNVRCGQAEERVLLTGLHAVADIYCDSCQTTLGWKYEHAFETSQKYKEGKYIIELAHMIKENGWD